jgi:hypothetical protein
MRPSLPALLCLLAACPALAAEPWAAVVAPDNSTNFAILQSDQPVLQLGLTGWGPSWGWVGLSAKERAAAGVLKAALPMVVSRERGEVIDIRLTARKTGPDQLTYRYDLSAAKDVPLTTLVVTLGPGQAATKGTVTLTGGDGTSTTVRLPFSRAAGPVAARAVLDLEKAGKVTVTFDPPCPVSFDGDLRIALASDVFPKGAKSTTITLNFPDRVEFLASDRDIGRLTKTLAGPDWYAFRPDGDTSPGVIGLNDWLDAPVGKHGGVRQVSDHFELADGTPIKFWGTNLSYGGACAPEKKDAEFTAARFAKYGINGVRLHKFTYPENHSGIGEKDDCTRMTGAGLDRLDYFAAQLTRRGVYYGWSHTYGFHVCEGNRARLLAYDEIAANLKGNTYAFINFAEDVQDLMIEMVVNLLKHRNPYTGKTYADDPALSFLELQNEDDIFFYTSTNAFKACPTYQKLFTRKFNYWLEARYKTEAALREAWSGALKPGETLAAKTVVPETNPWFFGDGHLPQQKGGERRRLLDTATYLHELQDRFYTRFVRAIREAGYQGPLCGSPWQAPAMLPHYLNLKSDALVGYVDRHNYFGGGLDDSMLARPGSGYFSSGLQQVAGRPFGLSEWIHVYPSLYSAEGPVIVAAYGLGLQGWDASYAFQSQSTTHRTFADRAGWPPWGVWEADTPTQLGQYPALARMVHRGDVAEGPVISTRRVHRDDLANGTFDFAESVAQKGDVKTFDGRVPAEALAAGRVVVEFTESNQPSTFPDLTPFRAGTTFTAATKQLAWDTAGRGVLTINTPGTTGVVGFAPGRAFPLGEATIELDCPYASVLLTALEPKATIATARRALLTAVARSSNTGFQVFALDGRILENGQAPILMEPVKATITTTRPIRAVTLLDHDGRPTGKTLPVTHNRFTIDGAHDRTLYYAIEFAP